MLRRTFASITLPSGPIVHSGITTPCTRACWAIAGYSGRTSTSLRGSLIWPPTRTAATGGGAGGIGGGAAAGASVGVGCCTRTGGGGGGMGRIQEMVTPVPLLFRSRESFWMRSACAMRSFCRAGSRVDMALRRSRSPRKIITSNSFGSSWSALSTLARPRSM
jgi:hypothetical protein